MQGNNHRMEDEEFDQGFELISKDQRGMSILERTSLFVQSSQVSQKELEKDIKNQIVQKLKTKIATHIEEYSTLKK